MKAPALIKNAADSIGYTFVPPEENLNNIPRIQLTDLKRRPYRNTTVFDFLRSIAIAISPDYLITINEVNESIILERNDGDEIEKKQK